VSKPFVPSPQQEAIFADIAEGEGHTVCISRAGSGKTTTLIEGLKHLPSEVSQDALLVAFNKKIAQELEQRAPRGVAVSTLHSYGLRQLSAALPQRPTVDKDGEKLFKILCDAIPKKYSGGAASPIGPIKKIVSMAKSQLAMKPEAIDAMIDTYDMALPENIEREDVVKIVGKALDMCLDDQSTVDFDDMPWMPCMLKMSMTTYARVFVDEGQDLAPVQIRLALKAADRDSRVLVTADDRQSCYAFRGADANAVGNIIRKLDAKTLNLSTTYRCAKAIVRQVRHIVPDFEAAPDAPEGIVREADIAAAVAGADAGDFIVSRSNAPLTRLFFKFVKAGKRVGIQGRDIGARLKEIVLKADKMAQGNVEVMLANVQAWKEKEVKRLVEKKRDTTSVRDTAACIDAIAEDASSVDEVLGRIGRMFEDNPAGDKGKIILGTTHAVKGLERDRVWMLRDTYLLPRVRRDAKGDPIKDEKGSWIFDEPGIEDQNLFYICCTRARRELVMVYGAYRSDEE